MTKAPSHPLARRNGIEAMSNLILADSFWRSLTKPQRELLLSTVAGHPIRARADVTKRLIARGWLAADPIFPEDNNPAALTPAGHWLMFWRPR